MNTGLVHLEGVVPTSTGEKHNQNKNLVVIQPNTGVVGKEEDLIRRNAAAKVK